MKMKNLNKNRGQHMASFDPRQAGPGR